MLAVKRNCLDITVSSDSMTAMEKLKAGCKRNEIAYYGPIPSYRQCGDTLILRYNVMTQHPGKRQLYLSLKQTESGTRVTGHFRISLFARTVTIVFCVLLLLVTQPWRTDDIWRLVVALTIASLYALMIVSGRWMFRKEEKGLADYVRSALTAETNTNG